MPYPELWTERQNVLAVIHPDLHLGTYYTPWVDMQIYHKLVALLIVGDITATGTVDLELQEATSAGGAGGKAIVGKAITQLTQAGGDSDDVCAINLRGEEMDAANDFRYVRARLDVLVANANACVLLLSDYPTSAPVTQAGYTEDIA